MKNRSAIVSLYKSITAFNYGRSTRQLTKRHIYPSYFITVLIFLIFSGTATAQSGIPSDATEAEIRRLEAEQVDYLMSGNVTEMRKKWASVFTVNNPFNVVQDAATGPIQTGQLSYSKFERNIEKVLQRDSVVIVMGNELVVTKTAPKGSSHDTTQAIKRRFTNVWMREDGKWLMIARQASDICSD